MRPMQASAGSLPPQGDGSWAYEIKWDGMRVLATRQRDGLRLTTRGGHDAGARFPEIASSVLALLPEGSVLDGEIVVLDDDGRPSFALLAPRIQSRGRRGAGGRAAAYVVFDLPRLGSLDLFRRTYEQRRRALLDHVEPGAAIVVAQEFDDGVALLRSTAEQGLEGVVAKRRDSTYQPGVRSRDWIKVPHRTSHSFVIGGWKSRASAPRRLASVLVGSPVGPQILAFDGAVGSGLTDNEARILLEVLHDIETTPLSSFQGALAVTGVSDVVHWVEPLLVVDVVHLGRSALGLLRQPSLARLRPDLAFADVAAAVPL